MISTNLTVSLSLMIIPLLLHPPLKKKQLYPTYYPYRNQKKYPKLKKAQNQKRVQNQKRIKNLNLPKHFPLTNRYLRDFVQKDVSNPKKKYRHQNQMIRLVKIITNKKKTSNQKKKKQQNNGLIKNKHKFFSTFEENPIEENVAEQEYLMDEELVFKPGESENQEPKPLIAEKIKEKVNQYRQKVELFNSDKKDNLNFKRGLSFTSNQDLTNQNGEQHEIELFIPKIKGNEDKIVQNTLFFNKMKNFRFKDVRSSPLLFKKQSNSYTREEYQKILKDQIKGKKKENISELLKKFQKTSFDDIEEKKKQMREQALKQQDDMSSDDEEVKFDEADLNKVTSEDISEVECVDNEDMNKLHQQKDKEDNKEDKEDKVDKEDKKDKEEEKIENDEEEKLEEEKEVQELDENDDDDDENVMEDQNEVDSEDVDNNIDNEKNQESDEDEDESELEQKSNKVENINESENEIQKQACLSQKECSDFEVNLVDVSEQYGEEEFQRFKKLRKISKIMQEKKEAEMRREQKKKERQERLKFIQENFVEHEAELGSDNEYHDDVVKDKKDDDDDDEMIDEEAQKELLEMIDNNVDINEENEERAFKIFMRKMDEQERNGI